MDKIGIQKELLCLGIKPSTKGFEYIAYAIEQYEAGVKITALYKDVADKYNTTASKVEKAIRHAKSVMINENAEHIEDKFHQKYKLDVPISNCLTNGDFISLMKFATDNIC